MEKEILIMVKNIHNGMNTHNGRKILIMVKNTHNGKKILIMVKKYS